MSSPAYAAIRSISSEPGHEADPAGPDEWTTFWREFGDGDNLPERCHVPGDGRETVDRHWLEVAAAMPQAGAVIDLGCGAGTVGRTLLHNRPDLKVIGIDFAEVPAAEAPNLTICPRERMEALPFGDASCDAAVSLFGIEYGDITATARELGRVLRPGSCFSFIVHHCDSEIAIEGSTRVRGIRDVLSGPVEAAFLSGDVSQLERQRLRLRRAHPGEPTVKLVCDYFWRNIGQARSQRQAIWRKLTEDVAVEVALTTRMTRCAKSAAELGPWLVPLIAIMAKVEISVLRRSSAEPIGWLIRGLR